MLRKHPPLNRTIVGWKLVAYTGLYVLGIALNRTIVGWKLGRKSAAENLGRFHFKSHHSGMETFLALEGVAHHHPFKSHHSGMETGEQYLEFEDWQTL